MVNVNFIGNLGADAELKTTKDGKQFLTFSIATDTFVKGNKERVWFRASLFDERRSVELATKLKSGSHVYVSGTLNSHIYYNSNGDASISRNLNVYNIEFVSSSRQENKENTETPQTMAHTEISCGVLEKPTISTPQTTPIPTMSVAEPTDDSLPF